MLGDRRPITVLLLFDFAALRIPSRERPVQLSIHEMALSLLLAIFVPGRGNTMKLARTVLSCTHALAVLIPLGRAPIEQAISIPLESF